jgi:hypothetical protein
VSDLRTGDTVTVLGSTSGSTITATAIVRGDAGAGFPGRFGDGRPGRRDGSGASGPGTGAVPSSDQGGN